MANKSIEAWETIMSTTAKPEAAASTYNPDEDGVTHVNVFTRGKVKLGRDLSNFQECNIDHPYFGRFRTLEGLWFYIKTGCNEEMFRIMNGHDCRKKGKIMTNVQYPLFTKMFKLGMIEKLEKNQQLQEELKANTLPLVHYYNYAGAVHVPQRHEWQIEFWQNLRETLLASGNLDLIKNELVEYIDRIQAQPSEAEESTGK